MWITKQTENVINNDKIVIINKFQCGKKDFTTCKNVCFILMLPTK